MWPRFEPRGRVPAAMLYVTPLLAVALTLATGVVLFALLGFDPLRALYVYFIEPISTKYGLAELAVKATPLTLIAVGLALGFRANVWNIGAEGQLTFGAICGGGLALAFYNEEVWWLLPAMFAAAAFGGMAWAAIPAWLRSRFNANEILTSLMLSYVALLFLGYLMYGPWRDPQGLNFPESRTFHAAAQLPNLLSGTRLHVGALIALAVAAAGWVVIARAFVGFQIKVVGQAPGAARFAGFSERRLVWWTFGMSGGLAGIAGLIEVAGPIGQLVPRVSPGYGFTAIIVAFLGRLHPVGIVLAALLIALSYIGGEVAQIEMRLPLAITGVFQGLLLFFLLGCDVLVRYRLRLGTARSAPGALGTGA
jgi:simple sugar transport system permease protein